MPRTKTINDIVNQVALEVGLMPVANVFTTADRSFAQLVGLANTCGYELLEEVPWQQLNQQYSLTTQAADDGKYDLPDNFGYMIDQTGWNRTDNVPLIGPLSGQIWQYLLGRDLVSYTIYASFRENEGQLWLFPQPPPVGIEISFEYISRNWVRSTDGGGGELFMDHCAQPADVPIYEPYLFERLLKLRFLEAKGFDTMAAEARYNTSLNSWKGKSVGAPVLNQAAGRGGYPLLNGWCNVPDTNYGDA